LHGLGFSNNDFDRFCSEFSGGWRMRIALAKLLLRKPQILLLDEPTNHLDLESRNWLEEYLKSYPFSVIMVSHDRFFMDQVCHRITEVWNSTLTDYHCNYSNYLVQRDERVARLREAKARQDEEIARMEDFISRFRYKADKASLVQSRVKQLEKIDRIVLPPERKKINFRFPDAPKSGKITLELKRATRSYGENIVLDQIDLVIERGEKIALVGPNGAGKSTLIRTLAGIDTLDRGERRVGHNVISDYFAQDQSVSLQGQNSVYDEILADAPFEMVPELRNILGTFLFSGDDVNKKVSVLSGGEKNRLALAKMLMRPLNLLLLDEPTNHLDLFSKEVLLRALRSFSGTVIFVSHDRFFIDSLATRVVEVGNRKVRSFIGNYEDYLQKTGQDTAVADVRSVPLVDASGDASVAKVAKEVRLLRREEQRERQKQERIREKRIAEIESEIDLKERELAELEARMGEPGFFRDPDAAKNTAQEHELLSGTLMGLYGEWEELSGSSVDEKPHPALTESV
jgi:ATP-binding cassette subfamily F protein 3